MTVLIKGTTRLDQVVFLHYNNLLNLDDVISKNEHLIGKLILEAGDKVLLPEYKTETKTIKTKTLWD